LPGIWYLAQLPFVYWGALEVKVIFQRSRRILLSLVLVLMLALTACTPKPASQFDQAQDLSTKPGAVAVARNSTQGSEFNQFFPKPGSGFERVFTQEKKGFAEAKLKKDGKDLAMLAISDTISLPSAAAKFKQSTQEIAGFPAVDVGTTQTAVLVDDRYQVKVLSRSPEFTRDDRVAWIQKFDLKGLSRLQ
jgi:hypothetical protein